ncbi:MAG: TerB family tellurite resistance protein [Alphaproteobacteria bacterium]|nr:TerB family tellurite resistance protein [Alphaproteobacteria bacterium]
MSDINNIVPSYLSNASSEEKEIFFKVLIHLSASDGHTDESEIGFIKEAAITHGIKKIDDLFAVSNEDDILKEVKIIKNRHLALELIKEMCMLSHVDNLLSDEETLFIGKVGIALGIEMEKIEQISNWVIDRIIWMEQAKYIFEEK